MIVFEGYISGKAEKHFFLREFMLISICYLLPVPGILAYGISLGRRNGFWLIAYLGILIIFAAPLGYVVTISSKKRRKKMITKKVVIDNEFITAITDTQPLTKYISAVKCVNEYADFYEIRFRFGNISNVFICQKDLITKGTLEEFEELFADKLIRK